MTCRFRCANEGEFPPETQRASRGLHHGHRCLHGPARGKIVTTGAVVIAPTGSITVNGGYFTARGPLTHNGELAVNGGSFTANSSAVLNGSIITGAAGALIFKGATSGAAQFDGPGYVEFSGSYAPGTAPGAVATVTFRPSVAFMPGNTNWNTIKQKTGTGAWTGSAGVTVSPLGAGVVRVMVTETLPAGTTRRFHRLESEEPLP